MSLYAQNFSEYTVAQSPSDWTNRWGTNWTHLVEANSGYGSKQLNLNADTADQRKVLSWDDIDADADRDDSEILVRIRAAGAVYGFPFGLVVRAGGPSGSEISYEFYTNADDVYLVKMEAGSGTVIASSLNIFPYADLDDNWYWIRFRVNGTSLKAKFWREDEEEKLYWDIEGADSSITAAGWVGVWQYESTTPDIYVDYFAVGTNGDSPPLPVDAAANIRSNQQFLQVAEQYDNPKVRVNQQFLQVAEQYDNPKVRVNQQFLQVAYSNVTVADYVTICINT